MKKHQWDKCKPAIRFPSIVTKFSSIQEHDGKIGEATETTMLTLKISQN